VKAASLLTLPWAWCGLTEVTEVAVAVKVAVTDAADPAK
jgi:hypothetical protein